MSKDKSRSLGKKKVIYLLLLIMLGGFIGSVFGEIMGFYTREGGILHNFFTKGLYVGLMEPLELDLRVLKFTFGFSMKLNFLSIFGFLFGIFLYKVTL